MVSGVNLILLGIYGLIACIALLIIFRIRSKKAITGSAIDTDKDQDFVDTFATHKRKQLAQQPWNMPYETYITISSVCAVVGALLSYVMTANMLFVAIAVVVGACIPELIVHIQSNSQKSAFEERYARGLKQFASALKSGMSIHQAVADVCQSPFVHDSIRKEFQKLSADLKVGISIKEAFERFATRVDCIDAHDVAIAIGMQSVVGGHEAEVIEAVAANISDRLMLRKEVNSMFAGSNGLVWAMDIMPVCIIIALFMMDEGLMAPYFSSPVMTMILIGLLAFMGLGSIVIHKQVAEMKRRCGVA